MAVMDPENDPNYPEMDLPPQMKQASTAESEFDGKNLFANAFDAAMDEEEEEEESDPNPDRIYEIDFLVEIRENEASCTYPIKDSVIYNCLLNPSYSEVKKIFGEK
eukprot:UN25250